jgi:hypothetical protein
MRPTVLILALTTRRLGRRRRLVAAAAGGARGGCFRDLRRTWRGCYATRFVRVWGLDNVVACVWLRRRDVRRVVCNARGRSSEVRWSEGQGSGTFVMSTARSQIYFITTPI